MPKPDTDFLIRNEGTVVMFTPISDAAKTFLREQVQSESWQWMGESLCVDHRPAYDLLHVLMHDECFVCERE